MSGSLSTPVGEGVPGDCAGAQPAPRLGVRLEARPETASPGVPVSSAAGPATSPAATPPPGTPPTATAGPPAGNASAPSFLALLAEDFETHDRDASEPGFWAVATHRIGVRALDPARPRAERVALDLLYRAMFRGVDLVWGIHLPRTTQLGRRVRLWHNGCMLLTAKSIGSDVHLRHDTTFGPVQSARRRPGELMDLPVIEDGVDVGSGACVLGNVRVGQGAVVGANSVVLKNVPAGAVVLGIPARIVPK